MVQYWSYWMPPSRRPGNEEEIARRLSAKYWKIEDKSVFSKDELRADLASRGVSAAKISCHGPDEGKRLLQLNSRSERGLLMYDFISSKQLRQFVDARGLDPGHAHCRKSRAEVIGLLEENDEEPAFPHFEDLAPELRLMIYDFHLQDLDTESAELPVAPPITRVSRLLRKESLPIFYSMCRLDLKISRNTNTLQFQAASKQHMARFQHVRLSGVCGKEIWSTTHKAVLTLDMPLGGILPQFSIAITPLEEQRGVSSESAEEIKLDIETRLKVFFVDLAARKAEALSSAASGEAKELVELGLGLRCDDQATLTSLLREA